MKPILAIALCFMLSGCLGNSWRPQPSAPGGPLDYSGFAALSGRRRNRIVWDLYDRREFGKPEHKPICRDLLSTKASYAGANATSWTLNAIELVEKYEWRDLLPLVEPIYRSPTNIWSYKRAFHCPRSFSDNPVPVDLVDAAETMRQSGRFWAPEISDEELAAATNRLIEESDKEVALVYALYVAGRHSSKGGTKRYRLAALEVLKTLDRDIVHSMVDAFLNDFDSLGVPEVQWIDEQLGKQEWQGR